MAISEKKNTCGSTDSSNVCMCEITRRVFENVLFGMYIILYIRTNHWLYNTTQIYLYFMLKQLLLLFISSSILFPLYTHANQVWLCKISAVKWLLVHRGSWTPTVTQRVGCERKTRLCCRLSPIVKLEGNGKKGRSFVTVIFRELNRQILLTAIWRVRYRQGEPVPSAARVGTEFNDHEECSYFRCILLSSSVFLILDGLRNAHALIK